MTTVLAAALAAAAFTATPASAAAEEPPRCDPGPCIGDVLKQKVEDATEEAIWAVRCIGDALGGNACHS